MNYYTIRWMDKNGVSDSERIAAETFGDAVKRVRMKAALCEGTPTDVECFGFITILEGEE